MNGVFLSGLPALAIVEGPLFSNVVVILLAVVSFILLYQLISPWLVHSQRRDPSQILSVPESLHIEPRFVLTKAEAVLYNLVCLAVRDSYLVLAKLPLRHLVKMTGKTDAPGKALLQAIQRISVDLVLIHPGTLAPVKIVLIESPHSNPDALNALEGLVDTVSQQAGFGVIRLKGEMTYTVPQLSKLLGVEMEE